MKRPPRQLSKLELTYTAIMVESFEVLIFVFLFDSSFKIDISIQQKTNLSNNFEGQNTKFYLKLRLLFVLAMEHTF